MSQDRKKSSRFFAAKLSVFRSLKKAGYTRLGTKTQTRFMQTDDQGQTAVYFGNNNSRAIGAMLRYSDDIQFSMKLFLGVTFNDIVIPMVEVSLNDSNQVKDIPAQLGTLGNIDERINAASYALYELVGSLKKVQGSTVLAARVFRAIDGMLNDTRKVRQVSELIPAGASNGLLQLSTVFAHYTIDHFGAKVSGRAWNAKPNGRYAPVTELRKQEKLALTAIRAILGE